MLPGTAKVLPDPFLCAHLSIPPERLEVQSSYSGSQRLNKKKRTASGTGMQGTLAGSLQLRLRDWPARAL